MPRKKLGHTFLSVEVPDAMLKAFVEKADAASESVSARVCRLIAADTGQEYVAPARGPLPGTKYKAKPGPKPKSISTERKSKKPLK